ncbi:23S rRNA (uracil(1939)-C(5))-methyltransferase RlmD [Cellulosilyticum sp. I15G10I2]|uniref:23S rRNA (uracil(1939)-C(5))-methyltransferase RlmD n=1 Tax=Cellulosilyticum sp. I15G10I2 TaxID=1892843 RepID=UPI00085C1356|nr:23S rRNA (uracil(1939)-C(5))-methyltransferase RlmD [Cellulosilyticum sp. I15G10I2]
METPLNKNERYEIEIIDIGAEGEGIGKIDDFIVFVPHTVTGDKAEVHIVKAKKSFAYGKMLRIIEPSPIRTMPRCSSASLCGGCQLQHIAYSEQLKWKTKKVKEALRRIGGLQDIQVEDTLGMEMPFNYRNKAQYPIRKENGELKIGFFAKRSHRIVASEGCDIQDPRNERIIEIVKNFLLKYNISIYNEETHQGLVRHLLIKTAYHTQEIMVCLVINGNTLAHQDKLIEQLKEIEAVKSIVLNHNTDQTNVILGTQMTVIYGASYIIDTIGHLKFKISPLSFFQVNPLQTKVLYDKALEFANLTGTETVWDAYCGIGTISLFLAEKAKKVYGVEIVPEAIENAEANAELNHITNAAFYVGKAEEVIPKMYQEGIIADTIVVDPPRKGCDPKLLETLITMNPKNIVYVSCDPATLARDLAYLTQNGFQVEKVQPVDMFPHTTHVETVCLMSRKDK